MTRNVAVDVRIWRNQHVVSDRDPTDDGAAGANPDAIPQGRTALPPASVLLPDSHSFVEIAITSNHRPRIDRDPVGMAEIQPRPDSCRMGYLKPVPTRHPPQQKSGEEPPPPCAFLRSQRYLSAWLLRKRSREKPPKRPTSLRKREALLFICTSAFNPRRIKPMQLRSCSSSKTRDSPAN